MKYKYIIAVFLLGVIFWVLASLQKILHTPSADPLFKVSAGIIVLSLLLAVAKLIFTKDKDSNLNK